jgi:hypothetical protein
MRSIFGNASRRLCLFGALIWLIGTASALAVYWTDKNDPESGYAYEMVNGQSYPVDPEDTKRYRRDLEMYGGKAFVLSDEFLRWLAGLRHGRALAATVECLSIVVAFGFFFVAYQMPIDPALPGEEKKPDPARTPKK